MTESKLKTFLAKYNPAVTSRWHIAFAGSAWGIVGLFLCRYSYGWLSPLQLNRAIVFTVLGIAIAFVVYRFGMSVIARKNIARLAAKNNKSCLFGFLTWKSYANIGLMVGLGVTLRHSSVSKDYLSLVYTSMGCALMMGSVQYFHKLLSSCPFH